MNQRLVVSLPSVVRGGSQYTICLSWSLLRIGSKRVFDQNIWAMLTHFSRKIGLEPWNCRLYKVRDCFLGLLHLNQEKWPTHSNQGLFTAKPVHGHVVCTLRVHPPTSTCLTLPRTLPCQIAINYVMKSHETYICIIGS